MNYTIELVYHVWDNVNGGSTMIQAGEDVGLINIDGVQITVEQIPGIIRVLEQLKQNYDLGIMAGKQRRGTDMFTCDPSTPVENSKSGRSDPPF